MGLLPARQRHLNHTRLAGAQDDDFHAIPGLVCLEQAAEIPQAPDPCARKTDHHIIGPFPITLGARPRIRTGS